MIYIFLFVLLAFLSFFYDVAGNKKGRLTWYVFIQIILILVAGLRYRIGGDTTNYIYNFYHEYPMLDNFSFDDYPIGKDPLYVLMNSIVKTLGGRFYIVQLIQALFVISLTFYYFIKHSRYIFMCAFFYFVTFTFFYHTMEIMRGAMSIVICLYANDYILKRKWFKAYLLFFLGLLFHIQTIALLFFPFFYYIKLNKYTVPFLVLLYFVGIYLQLHLLDYLDFFDFNEVLYIKAATYASNERFSTSGGNLNFIIVKVLPTLFYVFICLYASKRYNWPRNINRLQPFVVLGAILSLIQINIQIAYRYVDYYYVYFIIYFSEFFMFSLQRAKLERIMAYVRSVVIFLPFFFITGFNLYKTYPFRFIPYVTVMELDVDRVRESGLLKHGYPRLRPNEY